MDAKNHRERLNRSFCKTQIKSITMRRRRRNCDLPRLVLATCRSVTFQIDCNSVLYIMNNIELDLELEEEGGGQAEGKKQEEEGAAAAEEDQEEEDGGGGAEEKEKEQEEEQQRKKKKQKMEEERGAEEEDKQEQEQEEQYENVPRGQ